MAYFRIMFVRAERTISLFDHIRFDPNIIKIDNLYLSIVR